MKTIKIRVILAVTLCALLSAAICGGISIFNVSKTTFENSRQDMLAQCEKQGLLLNNLMERTSQAVDIMYGLSLKMLDDVDQFKSDAAYVDDYTAEMEEILFDVAGDTKGALTAYLRFNPEFTEPDSGIFLTRNDDQSAFESVTPTDFSMYSPDDLEHVGWYYIPVQNKQPTWMGPYYNSNIDVMMVSYVVPIYIDGESIGIIGMDINFSQFTSVLDETKIFDTGYAFLTDEEGNIAYHPTLASGDPVAEAGEGMEAVAEFLKSGGGESNFLSYRYDGDLKELCCVTLLNGMRFVMTAPERELQAAATEMTGMILIGTAVAILIAIGIGIVMGLTITKPITGLNRIVDKTAKFDFKSYPEEERIYQRQDECGQMAKSIQEMRSKLQEMVADIRKVYDDLCETTEKISVTTEQISRMSNDNSETTQGLAAAMEETAATMEAVNNNITDIQERAQAIRQRANKSRENSCESRTRADALKNTTDEASAKTTQMYETVQKRSEAAMEQAKAVEKINQLTQTILDISSQTNLLALNASIEAARAGEAGKGFAVVADEIGKLASETSTTAEGIHDIIKEVYDTFRNMAECLQESMNFLGETVLKDYDGFLNVAGQYRDDAAGFESDMTAVGDDVDALLTAIVDISGAVDDVSRTVEDSAEGVTRMAQKTLDVTETVGSNEVLVENNEENIGRLKHVIDLFGDDSMIN